MFLKKSFLFIAVVLLLSSCVSKKNVIYFQNDNENKSLKLEKYELKFKKNDLLTINVSSSNLIAVKNYNLPIVAYNSIVNSVNGVPKQQSYLIDSKGNIQFPELGELKLEGLTRVESIKLIEGKIRPYVNDVTVNIQILNFKINVLGDVSKPGTFIIENERATVIDALALAGDTNISGERIIEVKREANDRLTTGLIDLKSNKMFSSPYFYLQQNDIVYVKPNTAKVQSASYNQNTGLYISIASVLISLISILTR